MKRILVTGGTRGIGRAVVERLLGGGMAAVAVVSEENEPHRWEELEALGPAWHFCADLSIAETSSEAVRSAVAVLGGLDGVVHCAGVYPEGDSAGRSPLELWEQTMNVKARACYLLAHEFAQHAAEGASFVGISSVNAEQSEPDHLAYDAACAAIGGIIRSFAVHHAPRYRFNAVAPGLVATRLTQEVADDPRLREHACANIPLARIGSPDDCAGAVIFLLSADAAYITGETLFVDGGIRANQMSRGLCEAPERLAK